MVQLNKYGELIEGTDCPGCGASLKEEWVACPYCGARLIHGNQTDARDRIPQGSVSPRRSVAPVTLHELESWAYSGDGLNYDRKDAARWALQALSQADASADIGEIKLQAKQQRSAGGCFISTAVTTSLKLPDDCRDTYMKSAPERELDVEQYYRIAPGIVKYITQRPDAPKIWHGLWLTHLEPAIAAIERGDSAEAHRIYRDMFEFLLRFIEPIERRQL